MRRERGEFPETKCLVRGKGPRVRKLTANTATPMEAIDIGAIAKHGSSLRGYLFGNTGRRANRRGFVYAAWNNPIQTATPKQDPTLAQIVD